MKEGQVYETEYPYGTIKKCPECGSEFIDVKQINDKKYRCECCICNHTWIEIKKEK